MDYLLTNEGAALMTQAVSGKNLIFTRAEAGTGYSSSPAMLTQVIGSLQTLDMSVTHEGSDVRITCFLTNRELEQGYTLKQLGIYARLAETEADTLVVIGQQYSGEMIHPFADGEAEYEFVILMKASGTSSITVESGAGSLVTKRELNAHVNRMDNPHGVTKEDIGLDKVPNLTVDDMAPSFMEAEKRENVRSGEKSTILWGKVRKWLSDLKSGAFAIIANNCTTTEEGTVLDGRQGKALQDQIVELREADSEINSNMSTLFQKVSVAVSCGNIAPYGLFQKTVSVPAPAGHVACGIIGHGVTSAGGSSGVVGLRDARVVSGSSIYVGITNPYTVAAERVVMTFDVLCIPK